MPERIYTSAGNGKLKALVETRFPTEDELQALIAEHSEVLDGEQIRPTDARRWILVTREKGIAASAGEGARWSVDHLIIDQDAVPTLAEVKRGSSPEIRRSIVGQLLEYAVHASETWTGQELREAFERQTEERVVAVLLTVSTTTAVAIYAASLNPDSTIARKLRQTADFMFELDRNKVDQALAAVAQQGQELLSHTYTRQPFGESCSPATLTLTGPWAPPSEPRYVATFESGLGRESEQYGGPHDRWMQRVKPSRSAGDADTTPTRS